MHEKNLMQAMRKAEKETKKTVSTGKVLSSQIFEQIKTDPETYKYAIYEQMTDTWKLTIKPSFQNYTPMPKTPLTHPSKPIEYTENQLYNDVKTYIYKHLDLVNPLGYNVLTSFVFSTWLNELFDFTPYLGFYGREDVGKTRALETLKELCFHAWLTTGLTPATLFRLVERFNPTLLLDESEFLTMKDKKEMIGLLNAGQRRGVLVPRMREHSQEVDFFNVYCPKSISGTELLKRTTTSRTIMFTMTKNIRKMPHKIDKKQGLKLRNQLLSWRFHKIAELKDSLSLKERIATSELKATTEYPELEPLSGRTYELFYPLYHSATEKQNILTFATELEEMKLRAEKSELASIIFEAIINIKDTQVRHGLLLLKDIANYINADQERQYWIESKRIGTKCSQMGFEKTRTNRGTAIIMNNRIIERLRKDPRYSIDLLNYAESEESEQKEGYAKGLKSEEKAKG